jgi:DNA polymerase-3 subunit alpha
MSNYKLLLDRIMEDKKSRESGQVSMFTMLGLNTEDSFEYLYQDEYNTKYKLSKEKEMLKMYLTGHPLAELEERFLAYSFNTSMVPKPTEGEEENNETNYGNDGEEEIQVETAVSGVPEENAIVTFGGIITSVNKRQTKSRQNMAVVEIEDYYDQIEVLFFARAYEKSKELLEEDNIIEITGKFSMKDGEPKVYAQSARPIIYESKSAGKTKTNILNQAICFLLTEETQDKFDQIEKLLSRIPGSYPVYVQFNTLLYKTDIGVDDLEQAKTIISNVLGPHNVTIGNFSS